LRGRAAGSDAAHRVDSVGKQRRAEIVYRASSINPPLSPISPKTHPTRRGSLCGRQTYSRVKSYATDNLSYKYEPPFSSSPFVVRSWRWWQQELRIIRKRVTRAEKQSSEMWNSYARWRRFECL